MSALKGGTGSLGRKFGLARTWNVVQRESWAPGGHILTPTGVGLDRGPVKPGAKAGPLLLGSKPCCEQLLLHCCFQITWLKVLGRLRGGDGPAKM